MNDKVETIIPTIFDEMAGDDENESAELFDYYLRCNAQERAVANSVVIYLCGWSFETVLEKCGIKIDETGEPEHEKVCVDCQAEIGSAADLELCKKCEEAYDLFDFWVDRHNGQVHIQDFNWHERVRKVYRKEPTTT